MPHNNNAFQPKNARTIHTFDEDDDDDLDDTSLFGSSMSTSTKKATSGTQALADFLNTTSPEEFQRPALSSTVSTSSSSSSSNFFRLRKNKRTPQQAKSSSSTTTLSSTLSTTPSPTPTTTLSTLGDIPTIQQQQEQQQQQNNNSNNKHIKITPSRSSSRKQQEQRSLSLAPKSPTLSLSSSHHSSLAIRSNEPQSPILPNRRRESSLYSGSLRNNASLRGRMSDYGSSGRNHYNNNNNNHQRRNIMELFEQPPPLAPPPVSSSPSPNNNNIKPAKEIDQIDVALLQRLEQLNNEDTSLSPSLDQRILPKATTTTTAEKARITKARRHCQTQTIETCIPDPTSPLIDYQKDNNHNDCSNYNHYGRQQQTPGITVEQLEKQIADEKKRQKRLQATMKESTDQFEVLSGLAYMKLRELWEEKMRWEEAYFTLNERLDEIHQQQQETSLSSQGVSVPIPVEPGASLLLHQVTSPTPAQSI